MATATQSPVTLIPVQVLIKDGTIKISNASGTLTLDAKKLDTIWDSLSAVDQRVLTPIVNADHGKLTDDELSASDMNVIMGVRKRLLETPAAPPTVAEVNANPAPGVLERLEEENNAIIVPKPAPVNPAAEFKSAPIVLTSMANHTATVTIPEGEEYIGGPKVRKKRQRKTDPTILELYEDITNYCRAIGLDDMERQIAQLEMAKGFVSGKVKRMTYDIPSVIRAEIIEPTKVLRCIGPMPTESEVYGRDESFDRPMFLKFRSILDRYKKGSENHKRLGAYAKYRIAGIAFEDVNDLRETVSEALDEKLIAAHTRLIDGLGDADAAMAEAMKEAQTANDQEKANCAWANEYRARIRAAHEELNIALQSASQFDLTMETVDLLKGLRAVLASRRNSFNAQAAAKRIKGVEI